MIDEASPAASRAAHPNDGRRAPNLRPLLIVLGLSLVVKLALWGAVAGSDTSRFFSNDSHSYHHSARALVEIGRFAESPETPETPQTTRTPGYPTFLAAVYALAGTRPAAAIFAQILLSLLTVFLLWRIAQERWPSQRRGARIALIAAALLAFDPASVGHSLLLLTETLFTFCLCCLLYAALRFTDTQSWRWALGSGLALALATLVRPVSYYLVVPIAVWIALAAGGSTRFWKRAATNVTALVLPFLLLIGGWHLRNGQQTGTALFSRIEGVNMLFFRGAAIVAARDGIRLDEARNRLGKGRYDELHPETRGWTPERLAARWKQEGLDLILAHPTIFAKQQVRGLAAIFVGTGEHTLMRLLAVPIPKTGPLGDLVRIDPVSYLKRWPLGRPFSFFAFVLGLLYLGTLYGGSGSWLLSNRWTRDLRFWDVFALGLFLYLAVVSAGPEAYHRFRVPLTPILSLYGAAGLVALHQFWLRTRSARRSAGAAP